MKFVALRELLQRYLSFASIAILVTIIAIPLLIFLLTFLLFSGLVVMITGFPAKLGSLFPVDRWARAIIELYFNAERMESFRDEMMLTCVRYSNIDQGLDRWWMLREMELATERIDGKLRSGEFIIAILAGLASITLTIFAPIQFAGAVLTVFAIVISIAALVRITLTDILAYNPAVYQEAPYEEVAVRLGWNRGPINGRGAVLTAFGAIVAGLDERGYRIGTWIVEVFVADQLEEEDDQTWKSEQ